jgi:hypothetical protein
VFADQDLDLLFWRNVTLVWIRIWAFFGAEKTKIGLLCEKSKCIAKTLNSLLLPFRALGSGEALSFTKRGQLFL